MSKRYSIDTPFLDDGEDEEDIVMGNFKPSNLDRNLLKADEAVLEDISKQTKKKGNFFSTVGRKYKKLLSDDSALGSGKDSRRANRKVGFASNTATSTPQRQQGGGYAHLNNGSSDDSDFESDIEIDIRTMPRRRRKMAKYHGFLLILIGLFFLWFVYTSFLPFPKSGNDRYHGGNRQGWHEKRISNGTHLFGPTTIVVSLDGLHPHYVNKELTPHLHELMVNHGGAPYLIPSFPSSTFPNHWTMVTGLYPSNHGIVGNTFYDTKLEKQFFNTKPALSLNKEFWSGEPLWLTAGRQDVKSGIHMWPGSEVVFNSEEEKMVHVIKYNKDEKLATKRQGVFEWLDLNLENRPQLIMTYVPNVDVIGHKYGIAGKELKDELTHVDSLIGQLQSGIKERNLTEIVNLVVVSDHGMAPTSNDRLLYLDEILEMENIERLEGWPLIGITPKSNIHLRSLYENLQDYQSQFGTGKFDVYLREELPSDWKFGGRQFNKFKHRIAPIWLIPHVGWSFTTHAEMEDPEKLNGDYKPHGVHGYNNTEVLMRALFVGEGPFFDTLKFEPFENIGLYNLICESLGIQPAKNDGDKVNLKIISQSNGQGKAGEWKDSASYPGVDFKAEILKINSTYDELYGTSSLLTTETNKVEDKVTEDRPSKVKQVINYFKDKAQGVKDWFKDKYNSWRGESADSDEESNNDDSS